MCEVPEKGKRVSFIVGGLHHHENGHAQQYRLDEGVKMKSRDVLKDRT